jgi:putative glutathione S-transferase
MRSSVRHRARSFKKGRSDFFFSFTTYAAGTGVSPRMGELGWPFANVDKFPAADVDPLYGSEHVKDLYLKAEPSYTGRSVRFSVWRFRRSSRNDPTHRFTVPVLWDKKNQTIVNNESSEIIRIFNTDFNDLVSVDKAKVDIYPKELREEIDSVNDWVYTGLNSGAMFCAGLWRFANRCLFRWGL